MGVLREGYGEVRYEMPVFLTRGGGVWNYNATGTFFIFMNGINVYGHAISCREPGLIHWERQKEGSKEEVRCDEAKNNLIWHLYSKYATIFPSQSHLIELFL